jgi:DNA (cytosine-5)-methyltransferase 1
VGHLRAVSLFSNCGAGDVGYRRAGFEFEVMAELDPRRLAVARLNHPGAVGIAGDIRKTWPDVVRSYGVRAGDERPALLAACPPCQGMSSANGKRGNMEDADKGTSDARNLLVLPIAEVARQLQPRTIVVENVPVFLERKVRDPLTGAPVSAARLLASLLADEYVAFPFVTDLCEYGVPQRRKRAFLTFVRRDEPGLHVLAQAGLAPYPSPTHTGASDAIPPFTLRQALEGFGLPSLDARTRSRATSADPLHVVPVWTDHRYPMVEAIPPYSGRTAWQNAACSSCGLTEPDLGAAQCSRCGEPLPRPVMEGDDGEWRLIRGFRSSSYKRMPPDEPAPTITTASGHVGSHTTIHPWENRLLSTRECALLQTFPVDFEWGLALQLWGHTNVRAMIGEAVPPRFTLQHGLAIRATLDGDARVTLISRDDGRCVTARRRLLRAKKQPAMQAPGS